MFEVVGAEAFAFGVCAEAFAFGVCAEACAFGIGSAEACAFWGSRIEYENVQVRLEEERVILQGGGYYNVREMSFVKANA